MNNPLAYLAGRGPHPAADTQVASPVLLDPMYYDPNKVPALVGPSDYWTGVVSNFTPAIHDANVIASTQEAGWTADVQPMIDYTGVAADNTAVNQPNQASGVPAGARMSLIMGALEEHLTRVQDFLLGAP